MQKIDPRQNRHKTAMSRGKLSRPMTLLLESGLVEKNTSVFDYGCGRGDDLKLLRTMGFEASGWDPNYAPDSKLIESDVVNLGFVLNVIEKPTERVEVLRKAFSLAREVLVTSVRLVHEMPTDGLQPYKDGFITRRNTFQKFYEQQEFRQWLDAILDTQSVAVGPGIFFVFKNEEARESFLASRCSYKASISSITKSEMLFDQHKEELGALLTFFLCRGRLPGAFELEEADSIISSFGSLRRAFSVLQKTIGEQDWQVVSQVHRENLLVYLALQKFGKRLPFSKMPPSLRLDIKAFFSSYTKACKVADTLLFAAGDVEAIKQAARQALVGKVLPDSLYIHKECLEYLPPLLRVYEGCARFFVGDVMDANLIKLHLLEPRISYLAYPNFDKDPHPALATSLLVDFRKYKIKERDYSQRANPPILHRKEQFVSPDYPGRSKFEKLTKQEEKWGLYDAPQFIGTRDGWNEMLKLRGAVLKGHRLFHVK